MDDKHKLILAVGLTAVLTDMIPTPADYFVFRAEQSNKQLLEKGLITPKQYWSRSAAWYYLANPAYWALVTGVVFAFGKTFSNKVNIGIALASVGAVAGVLAANIRKDEQLRGKIN